MIFQHHLEKKLDDLEKRIEALEQESCDYDCEHCDWVECPLESEDKE